MKERVMTPNYHETRFIHQGQSLRIDHFLREQYPTLSRSFLQKKILQGEVLLNKKPINKIARKVFHEDEVIFFSKNDQVLIPPKIIYEDENLLVVNKPPFMLSHIAGKELFNIVNNFFPFKTYHVHRLDKETSGVFLLAKTLKKAQELIVLFEQRKIRKEYLCLIRPCLREFPLLCEARLKTNQDKTIVHSEGKVASTFFECLEKKEETWLLKASPLTGRQHQIRVHAAYEGFPLIGDKVYGLGEGERHLLHAYKITLPDQTFTAEIPEDFKVMVG